MTVAEGSATLPPATGVAASPPRAGSTSILVLCLGGYAFVFGAVVAASAAVVGLLAVPRASSPATARRHALCALPGQLWHRHERELDASVWGR
jgi:hypothetical protein